VAVSIIAQTRTESVLSVSSKLWGIVLVYAFARYLQAFPGQSPPLVGITLHVLAPLSFALIHGTLRYGRRGMAGFVALCLVVGFSFEILSLATGFPFGHFVFTDLMGPKFLQVPILLGLAYIGMGYISWTVGGIILGEKSGTVHGANVVMLPIVASFVMVAWDLSNEPVWSTIERAWTWIEGGPYFGVPVSNFLGWYLTVFVIYLLFAIYLRLSPRDPRELPRDYWTIAVVAYAVSAAGNLLMATRAGDFGRVEDPAGVTWSGQDIVSACGLIALFTMGAFCALAWARLAEKEREGQGGGGIRSYWDEDVTRGRGAGLAGKYERERVGKAELREVRMHQGENSREGPESGHRVLRASAGISGALRGAGRDSLGIAEERRDRNARGRSEP